MAVKLIGGGGEGGGGGGGGGVGGGCRGAMEVGVQQHRMEKKRAAPPVPPAVDKKAIAAPPPDPADFDSTPSSHGSSQRIVKEDGPPTRQTWQVGYQREYQHYDGLTGKSLTHLYRKSAGLQFISVRRLIVIYV